MITRGGSDVMIDLNSLKKLVRENGYLYTKDVTDATVSVFRLSQYGCCCQQANAWSRYRSGWSRPAPKAKRTASSQESRKERPGHRAVDRVTKMAAIWEIGHAGFGGIRQAERRKLVCPAFWSLYAIFFQELPNTPDYPEWRSAQRQRFRLRRSRAWFGHPQALCLYGDAKNNHFVESIKIFLFQRVKRSFCLISDCLPVQDSVEFKTEKGRSHKWGSPWILFACDRRFIRNCRQIRPGAVKIWNAEQDHDQKIDQDDRCKQDDDRFPDPARTAVSDRKLLIDPG